MAADRRINVNIQIDGINQNVRIGRDVWFPWKDLCRANHCSADRSTQILIQEKLQQFGIDIIPGSTWSQWKSLCHANRCSIEMATEVLIAEKLKELGIEIRRGEFADKKVTGQSPMVKS